MRMKPLICSKNPSRRENLWIRDVGTAYEVRELSARDPPVQFDSVVISFTIRTSVSALWR
jgi:hypothetical protein